MENFLENFPPKNASGTDEEKIKELNNERVSILKTFDSFTRLVLMFSFCLMIDLCCLSS